MPLEISIEQSHAVVLVTFRGELAEADFTALETLGRQRQTGPHFDVVFDFSDVRQVDLATEFIASRGQLPQTFSGRERIYVVPQDDLKLLVKLYAAYRQAKGWQAPLVVNTLAEALDKLRVSNRLFLPVSVPETPS
jgi:hypothetical protein